MLVGKEIDGETWYTHDFVEMLSNQNKEKDKEIERLNNIINELKKGIENMYVDDAGEDIWEYEEEYLYREEFLDKIEELKGSDKE